MRNVDLTWAQDPGFVTEVISGAFYQPLGRSSSHQLWSSAMVLTPAIRGLFGIEADAVHRTLRVQPHLPAAWEFAELNNIRVGDDLYAITLKRERGHLLATVRSEQATVLCLKTSAEAASGDCRERPATVRTVSLPLPPVKVTPAGHHLPKAGATPHHPPVPHDQYQPVSLPARWGARAGTTATFS